MESGNGAGRERGEGLERARGGLGKGEGRARRGLGEALGEALGEGLGEDGRCKGLYRRCWRFGDDGRDHRGRFGRCLAGLGVHTWMRTRTRLSPMRTRVWRGWSCSH